MVWKSDFLNLGAWKNSHPPAERYARVLAFPSHSARPESLSRASDPIRAVASVKLMMLMLSVLLPQSLSAGSRTYAPELHGQKNKTCAPVQQVVLANEHTRSIQVPMNIATSTTANEHMAEGGE